MLDLMMIGGSAVAKKLAILSGLAIGSYAVARSTEYLSSTKSKMKQLFELSGLYVTRSEGRKSKLLPVVEKVYLTSTGKHIQFRIPVGLNPDKVHDTSWIFKQAFGESILLTNENDLFTLSMYQKLPNHFEYNYSEIAPLIEEMHVPIVVGKSLEGWEVYDMVNEPGLVIAGEPGGGKSTQLRTILTTLITSKEPQDLHLFLVDLKMSEFFLFEGVEHVQGEVADTVEGVRDLLNEYLIPEMERRKKLLKQQRKVHVKDLDEKLPFIILCIDEVSLLRTEKEVMKQVENIAAIGRALGMYLILSMQRPDSEVINGRLKFLLTIRMAFRHNDTLNYRITLGEDATDRLPEEIKVTQRGRMYFKHVDLKLVQGPFLSEKVAEEMLSTKKEPIFTTPGDLKSSPVENYRIL